ncbi:FAD/NAD(P)-binding protein [Salinicoccus sp. CNSTN-B1]
MKQTKVAIIGGGVTGVSILSHLVHDERFTSEITVDVYDNAYTMGRGQAYQEDNEHLLINVPADEMSLGRATRIMELGLNQKMGKRCIPAVNNLGIMLRTSWRRLRLYTKGST